MFAYIACRTSGVSRHMYCKLISSDLDLTCESNCFAVKSSTKANAISVRSIISLIHKLWNESML